MLEQLRADRDRVAELQHQIERGRESNGSAEHAEQVEELADEQREVVRRMQQSVLDIDGWGITLRDISTGLIDFPALAMDGPSGCAGAWAKTTSRGGTRSAPASRADSQLAELT